MHPSVHAAWHAFSEPFEGRVHSLYVDVLGLVTTGVGNLVDPVHLALELPWKLPGGELASKSDVLEQWQRVKHDRERLKKLHWKYAAELTTIRITDQDIDDLVAKKLVSNERELLKWFPSFLEMPADAQLGILSLAWAAGPAFAKKFPNFTRAANAGKWWEAAESGQLRATGPDGTPNPGVIPRNKANKVCFENASGVVAHGEDPSVLWWPRKFVNPMHRTEDLSRKPEAAPGTIAEAFQAAVDSRFDNEDAARREAVRDMARMDDEPLLAPADEDTVVDGKGNA